MVRVFSVALIARPRSHGTSCSPMMTPGHHRRRGPDKTSAVCTRPMIRHSAFIIIILLTGATGAKKKQSNDKRPSRARLTLINSGIAAVEQLSHGGPRPVAEFILHSVDQIAADLIDKTSPS